MWTVRVARLEWILDHSRLTLLNYTSRTFTLTIRWSSLPSNYSLIDLDDVMPGDSEEEADETMRNDPVSLEDG